jgi:AcrR family transcriptional regulator
MDTTGIVRRAPFGANPVVGERGSDTQRRILAAALDVFGEVGFAAAGVEHITERAGCSRPAFYQYFSSKDDVFWELASRLGEDMVALADRLGRVAADADGLAALRAWIGEFMDLHEAQAPVFAGFQAASRSSHRSARNSAGISDRTGHDLLRAFGLRRTARRATLATGTVAVLIRCSFYAETMPRAIDRAPLVDGLAQAIHRLFAGPIPGVNMVRAADARPGRHDHAPAPAPEPSPDGRARRVRGERTRQRLLDTGATVLPARGYHDTRVDDIVAAAAVSHGTFYRYFDNKDDFFRVLAEEASAAMIELLDRFRPDGDADELRAWLRDWFATYASNGGVISTWQEMLTNAELVALSRDVAAAVLARLARALAGRGFGDPDVDAVTFLAVVERLPYSAFTLGFTTEHDAVDAMATIVRRGLFGLPDPV